MRHQVGGDTYPGREEVLLLLHGRTRHPARYRSELRDSGAELIAWSGLAQELLGKLSTVLECPQDSMIELLLGREVLP